LIAIEARVGTGSATEAEFAGSGITHLLEHMLFKGTKSMRVGEIEKRIKGFGGAINGFTSHDYTGYRIVILKEHFNETLTMLKEILFDSSLDAGELEREKDVILKEIRMNRDEPSKYVLQLLWSTAYRAHPYHNPIIGYEEIFNKLTRNDLIKYYKRMYVPSNIVLGIAGDVDSKSAYIKVYDIFKNVQRKSFLEVEKPKEPRQISKRIFQKREDVKLAYFAYGFQGVSIFSKDMFALDVLSIILGEGASSRLNQSLYRDKELVYSLGSWNYTPKDPGIFIISGLAEPEKLQDAEDAIWAEIEKIKEEGIDEDELTKAKNGVLAGYISSRQTVTGQASDVASSEFITGDYDFSQKYVDGINSLSSDDIEELAFKYLSDKNVSIVKLLPESFETKDALEKDEIDESTKIQEHLLSNGIKVLLKEDHRFGLVSINALFKGGLRVENKDNNGMCSLMASMLLKGTDEKSEKDITKTVETLGGNIAHVSGNNSFGISLSLLSKDVDVGVELLGEIITSPTFEEQILEREKNTVLAGIRSEEDDIYQHSMRLLKETLFERHPYRMRAIGSSESIRNIKRSDIVSFYNTWCRPNNMVLSIFGDIESEEILKKIKKNFAHFEKGILPPTSILQEKIPKKSKEIKRTADKTQSVVMIGFLGTTIYDKDKYTLSVISSILSGKSGRLSMRIRERLGMAYTLGSFSLPGIDPGYYLFYVGTTANRVGVVKKELLKQIRLISAKYVSDSELKLAKKELIGNRKIALQTNSALSFQTGLDELYGLGYEDYLNYENSVMPITRNDILNVARKYFNPKISTILVVKGVK